MPNIINDNPQKLAYTNSSNILAKTKAEIKSVWFISSNVSVSGTAII